MSHFIVTELDWKGDGETYRILTKGGRKGERVWTWSVGRWSLGPWTRDLKY